MNKYLTRHIKTNTILVYYNLKQSAIKLYIGGNVDKRGLSLSGRLTKNAEANANIRRAILSISIQRHYSID